MRMWYLGLTALLALAALLPAVAQEETGSNNLRVRLGMFFPQKDETRDASDKVWLALGAEYALLDIKNPSLPIKLSASVDFMGNDDMQNIPVQLNLQGLYDRFDWSLGVGLGFAKNTAGQAKTGLTYSVGVSVQLNSTAVPLSLGVMWRGMTNVGNQLDGIAVYLQASF